MPTVFKQEGFRFFFFSREGQEPLHVHVEKAEKYAKFWLKGPTLDRNRGFRSHELTVIRRLVARHRAKIEERWHEHFGG